MIINSHGAFEPNDFIKIIPYQHHLYRRMWMVFVDDGDVDMEINRFAVYADENEEAADTAYRSYLRHIKAEEEVLMENIKVAKEKAEECPQEHKDLLQKEKIRYEEWLKRKNKHKRIKTQESEDE